MSERIRLGYVKEYLRGAEIRNWVADQDMTSTDPEVSRDVQRWLHGISQPYTTHTVQYNIHPRMSGDEDFPECPWVCEYTVYMYDAVYAVAIGHGKTEEEAVSNVKKMVQENVKKYLIDFPSAPRPSNFDEKKFIAEFEAQMREDEKNES